MSAEKPKYISLQEATRHCSYSQEYLSLRARAGKLRAIKIGRNWVTTKSWLEEYVGKAEEFKVKNGTNGVKELPPPENLPMEEEVFDPEPSQWFPMFARAGVVALTSLGIVLFAVGGVAFGKDGFVNTVLRANTFVQEFGTRFDAGVSEARENIVLSAQDFGGELKENSQRLQAGVMNMTKSALSFGEDTLVSGKQGLFGMVYRMNGLVQEFGTRFDAGVSVVAQTIQTIPEKSQEAQKRLVQEYEDLSTDINDTYTSLQKEGSRIARTVPALFAGGIQKLYTFGEEFGQGFDVEVSLTARAIPEKFQKHLHGASSLLHQSEKLQ